MPPRQYGLHTVTLSGRRLIATLEHQTGLAPAVCVGIVSGWLARRPPPPADTTALLRAFQ